MSHRGSCRPDPVQQMLIRTVLAHEEELVRCWRHWQSASVLEELDPGSLRLLPLLYHRLKDRDLDAADLHPYRNVYRHFWYRNRVYMKMIGETTRTLNGAGMTPLLLKGLPLALEIYPDPALRPMLDLDIWLPPEQLAPAVRLLRETGWVPDREPPEKPDNTWLAAVKAIQLDHQNGTSIDLHGTIMSEIADPDFDRQVLERSRLSSVLEGRVRIPAGTDLFFHTVSHGLKWNALPPFRWIVDAAHLMNKPDNPIDREQLATDAQQANLVTRLAHGLSLIQKYVGTNGSQQCQALTSVLDKDRRPSWERLEHRLKTRNHVLPARFGFVLFDSWRWIKRFPAPQKPGALRQYLKLRWNVTRSRKLPAAALNRARNRIRAHWGKTGT